MKGPILSTTIAWETNPVSSDQHHPLQHTAHSETVGGA